MKNKKTMIIRIIMSNNDKYELVLSQFKNLRDFVKRALLEKRFYMVTSKEDNDELVINVDNIISVEEIRK